MKKYLLTIAAICFAFSFANAQSGALDLSFNPGTGANATIHAVCTQNDGKIIIGGEFTNYNGTAINQIARLNTDGSLDTTFNPGTGADARVLCATMQNDGKIIIGGDFTNYNGTARNYIARINTDGSIDSSFNPGTGASNSVYSISIQSNEQIIIAGAFNNYNGTSLGYIARLNTNGSLDGSFNSSTGANDYINSTAIQPDGNIVIGGQFTNYGGGFLNTRYRLTRLQSNGSLDGGFYAATTVSSNVLSITLQSNGQIMIGGDFNNINGSTINHIARINSNGQLDGSFNPGTGANSTVNSISIQNDGKIIAGGNFTNYNGTTVGDIVRLITATIDNSFNSTVGANGAIFSTCIQSDGRILIGGSFTGYDGITRNSIARLYGCTTPMPGAITGDTTTVCPGSIQQYSISPVIGANNYTWTLPAGWTGSSNSTSITATSSGTGGIISVVANSDSCGSSAAQTLAVTQIAAPNVPICLVTVDDSSTHNVIIWEKPITAMIDSFFVYREVTTNVYAKIASIPYDSLSEYNDYGADPNSYASTYKLAVLDSCGVEWGKSDYHTTIHLQNLGSGNLIWSLYAIENDTNPVVQYNCLRDDLGNGNFSALKALPGDKSSWTDSNFVSFPNAEYVLDVTWGISCTPTRVISTTRSNIRKQGDSTGSILGIRYYIDNNFEIYPNPSGKTINLSFPSPVKIKYIEILNLLGEPVYKETPVAFEAAFSTKQIDIGSLSEGVYILRLENDIGAIMNKLIIRQ